MEYNHSPKNGDPVRIRRASGLIVDAIYDEPYDKNSKEHWICDGDDLVVASRKAEQRNPGCSQDRVRFVYPVEQMK